MKRIGILLFFCFSLFAARAQETALTPAQIETLFLERNLVLIAERMNVSIADAAVAEAKVWDNPEFSIGDLNVWTGGEEKQFSAELSQMFSLSAKRAKLAAVERVGKEIAVKQFEELLRGMKTELRNTVAETLCLQNTLSVIETQRKVLQEVIAGYRIQYEKGNIAQSDLLRLQTALFSVEGDLNDTRTALNARQRTLKNLLSTDVPVRIAEVAERFPAPASLDPMRLTDEALATRPDLETARLQSKYFEKDIIYQRSLAMPDVSLGIRYDRYGGVWKDFYGVGVGMQIPLFNRNKGAIKTARIQLRQNETLVEQEQTGIRNEVLESFQNYASTYEFLENNVKNPALEKLDEMVGTYTGNLLARNISLVEYMDFMNSYRTAKEQLLAAQKQLRLHFEQLQYAIGHDLN